MPEETVTFPVEAPPEETVTQAINQSDFIFDAVYNRLTEIARTKTMRREYNPAIGGTEEVPTDPAVNFVGHYYDGANRSLTGINGRTGSIIVGDYITDLQTNPDNGTRQRGTAELQRQEQRTTDLVTQGLVDPTTAQLFWASLKGVKTGLSTSYNDLMYKHSGPPASAEQQAQYQGTVSALLPELHDVQEQETGGFLHVNGSAFTGSESQVTDRVYVASDTQNNPGEVVAQWAKTLKDLGLSDRVYYKFTTHVMDRSDSIVIYKQAGIDQTTFDTALKTFIDSCDPALLSSDAMPTAVQLAKGVARAPEPITLNTLLRYATREGSNFDQPSYNETIAALSELAMRRAAIDAIDNGIPQASLMPRALKESGQEYFKKLLLLSGLDPQTMENAA